MVTTHLAFAHYRYIIFSHAGDCACTATYAGIQVNVHSPVMTTCISCIVTWVNLFLEQFLVFVPFFSEVFDKLFNMIEVALSDDSTIDQGSLVTLTNHTIGHVYGCLLYTSPSPRDS